MFSKMSRGSAIALWFSAIVVFAACGVFFGVGVTRGNGALLLAACVVPPAIMLFLWPGAQPMTIAEVLHSDDGVDRRA